jgi:hypothetical protein
MQRCDLGGGLASSRLPGRAFSTGRKECVQRFDVRRRQVAVEDVVKGLQL